MSDNLSGADFVRSGNIDAKIRLTGRETLKSVFAHLAVFTIYLGTLFFAATAPLLRKLLRLKMMRRSPGEIQILVTGTFYNEGWIRGHLVPLAMARSVGKVWVVCDRPWFPLEKVCYVVPSSWLRRLCGRSLSRIIMVFVLALQQKPDLLMGYHIMPNALVCLVAASIIGARSAYQMTGGPVQVVGGGTGSENSLLRLLQRRSALLERLLFHTLSYFDLVVVRGHRALTFARKNNFGAEQIVITAGIDTNKFRPGTIPPDYDIICVARLVIGKGLEYLIEVLHHCHQNGCKLKAAIVGDGPIKPYLSDKLAQYDLLEDVVLLGQRNDISSLLQAAKVFTLTSPSEGMSIALLEALAAGLPAAITPVGDLGDAVKDGVNGIFLDGNDAHLAAARLTSFVEDDAAVKRMSERARQVAEKQYSIQSLAQCWDNYLSGNVEARQ